MKRFALVLLVLASACDDDKPDTAEVAAQKTECKTLLEHIVSISPQGAGQDAKKIVDALPIEDIQACIATDPEVRGCMSKATDVARIKLCPALTECANTARAAQKDKSAGAADYDGIIAKCLAGDPQAADSLKKK